MRKISFIALFAAVIGMTMMSSCKKDDTTASALPTVTFQGGNNSLTFDGTAGIDIIVDFTADAKVSTFKLTFGDSLIDLTSTYSNQTSGSYRFQRDTTQIAADLAASTTGTVEYVFTLVDKDQNSKSATYTVTAASQATPINTYPNISLTSAFSGPTTNEYFDATTGTAYNHADNNAANATFGFVSGGGHGACIFGSDFSLTLSSQPSGWSTAARFATTTLTGTDFDNIADETSLLAAMPSSINLTEIYGLEDGGNSYADNSGVTVIAFQVGSKKGLIKLPTSINNTTDQTVSVSVKVQQ